MSIGYGPRVVTDGLVLALDAADTNSYSGSGTTWSDLSGNGYNGTLTNEPTYSSDNGGYFSFDGTNDYVTTNLTRDNNDFTYAAWFQYASGTGERDIIDTFEATSSEWTRLNVLNGKHAFHIDNNSSKTILQGSDVQTNVWYYQAGTYDSSNGAMKLYVNGELNASTTHSQTGTISGLSNLRIGAIATAQNELFNGKIARVTTYSRTLSASEIQQNFNALRGRFGI